MALTILKVGRFDMLPYLEQELKARGDYYVDTKLTDTQRAQIRAKTDIVVASGGSQFQAEDFDSAPNLKAIVCFSVGYDGINVEEAIKRNIFVTHTPNVLNDDVANTALMLMLNCTREFKANQDYIEQGKWGKAAPYPLTTSIGHKKLGIAGFGRIGKEIAARAAAFKMEIGYFGRHQQEGVAYPYFSSLKDLATWADVLMLAMPASSENKHCVNKEILTALGAEGYLVNIARGSIVNTEDLIYCLQNKIIAGAALDAYENEPDVPSELMGLPNVALQPHIGSATHETRTAMAQLVIDNLDAILQGRQVITPVPGTRTK